jgi:hypothetical protein
MTIKKKFLILVLFVSFGLFIYMFYSSNFLQNSVHKNFVASNSPLNQLFKGKNNYKSLYLNSNLTDIKETVISFKYFQQLIICFDISKK